MNNNKWKQREPKKKNKIKLVRPLAATQYTRTFHPADRLCNVVLHIFYILIKKNRINLIIFFVFDVSYNFFSLNLVTTIYYLTTTYTKSLPEVCLYLIKFQLFICIENHKIIKLCAAQKY